MNLRFLEAFLWVARLKSFKGAAEKLHTTQAAISNRIATLESELGVRLFERDSRSVIPTYRGTELIPLAEKMLELHTRMRASMAEKESFAGTLRIGVMETIVHTWLPALLSRFSQQYPNVTVELISDITPHLRDELIKGRLDCALLSEEITEGFIENSWLGQLEMGWFASPTLAVPTGTLSFKDIAAFPIISFHKQSIIYRSVLQLATDDTPLRVNFFSSLAAMISLTKTGFGVAPFPIAVIENEIANGTLRRLDVKPALAPLPLVASIRSEPASPLAEELALLAVDVCAEFLSSGRDKKAGSVRA